ncbi:DUF4189 domain-containing protein [Lysobacter capsici]|uniref:DUF4189 domain-containing protein n=1 Tax=Lysobacter capsici TaxID=435897 RepID=UPI001C003F02|nr:DUF4189 domain-containing protein [Lysobacter capsici]QWF16998.1 DUF4189 domain-containing protein [Lysobacter capsici]
MGRAVRRHACAAPHGQVKKPTWGRGKLPFKPAQADTRTVAGRFAMSFTKKAVIGLIAFAAAADACAQQSNEQNFREQQAVQQQQHAASQARQGYEASQYGAAGSAMAGNVGYTPPVIDNGYRSSFGAVVFGAKAGAVSVWYSGEADSFPLAEAEALRKCTADGGNGCAVAETGVDGYIGVAVAADGTRFAKYRASEHDALELAVGACEYGAGKQGCKAERAYPVLPRRTR